MSAALRLIARLDVKDRYLVKGIQYEGLRKLGDPNAFAPDKPAPTITVPGKSGMTAKTGQAYTDEKYKNNPFYHPKGE